jgi:transposase
LAEFFAEIGPLACARIRHVAMDMSEAYAKAVRASVPNAEIVYDRFHVQKLVSAAVDKTRREEWQRLRGTLEGNAIKHTRWALLKSPWNLTQKQDEALARPQSNNQRLYRAYLLKESFVDIYRALPQAGWARRKMSAWLSWASRSKLGALVHAARTIRKHLDGVLAYFRTGYTNSQAEGLNNKARLATRHAYGFHSADAVRAMIELRCSGIHLTMPHLP